MDALKLTDVPEPPKLDPFRRAVVRGLAVLLPPLLTIVIFLWVGNTVTKYLLEPLESFTRKIVVRQYQGYILPANAVELSAENEATGRTDFNFQIYQRLNDERFVLADHYDYLRDESQIEEIPANANEFYRIYVERRFFQPYVVIPLFLCLFILVLYLLGKFLAAGVGRFFWIQFERVIHRLPVIRNVYSSVKQVTDFLFSERDVEYTRVVAVEYPRKGIWSLAMVTGESLLDIRSAANEPVLSVLVPTSPMPFTGFTVTVLKSETLDLNLTIDQAFQFIVSCGVVVPPHQLAQALVEKEKASGTSPGLLPSEGDRFSPTP